MIAAFAPEPDIIKVNPVFKKAAPMKLYAPDRIHTIEQSEAFITAFETAKGRKVAASKAVQTKKKRLIDIIDSVQIHIEEDTNLLNHAISDYNSYRAQTADGIFKQASKRSNPLFLERICVNYARHNLTRYDELIGHLYKKVGKQEAYRLLKRRTLAAIALQYPDLADECRRQALEADES